MPVKKELVDHYRILLGLTPPWQITDIIVDAVEQRIDIMIAWPENKRVPCPVCGKKVALKDHREERVWRHLDTMQFQTFLHCRVPRSECREDNVKTISVPWSEAGSRWTLLFEAFALLIMENVPVLKKSASILHLSWDEACALRKRAVERGLEYRELEGIEHVGLDEKSFGKKEPFVTVLSDLDAGRVLEVTPAKSAAAGKTALGILPEPVRDGVQAVAMDMSAAYESACAEMLPEAAIVYDKFHVTELLSKAMDTVRRMAHKDLLRQGITVLKKKRYVFLRRRENWTEKDWERFREIEQEYGAVKFAQSTVGRALSMKDTFAQFWEYCHVGWALRFFRKWYFWATHSRLRPFITAAKTIKAHLDGVLAHLVHGITNALAESMNSKIQYIKAAARGYRNFHNYRIAILFHCGKLDMQPVQTARHPQKLSHKKV